MSQGDLGVCCWCRAVRRIMTGGEEDGGCANEVRGEGEVFVRAVGFADVEMDEEGAVEG